MSFLGNLWDVGGDVVKGILDFDAPKQKAKLGDDINFGLLAKNFAPDMKEAGEEIKTMVENPSATTNAFADLVGGAIGSFTPNFINEGLLKIAPNNRITNSENQKLASNAWSDIVQKYGSLDGFKQYAQNEPFDAMLELTGLGLVAKQVKDVSAPVVIKAIAEAEKNGLMDEIRRVGSLPVGLSIKDVSKMNASELKKLMASQEIYNEYLGKVDPNFVMGQPLSTQSDPQKLAVLKTEIIGQDQDLITPSGLKLQDLEGKILMGFESDRTDAGGILSKVNDFTVNTKLFGGIKFQLLKEMVKREDLWASDITPLDKIKKQAQLIKDLEGQYPLVTQYIMQPQGSNFAHMTQQLMMEVYQQALPTTKKNKLNKEIKKVYEDWESIDADNLCYALSQISGEKRKRIGKILGKTEYTDHGLSLAETGLALTDKTLVNAPRGTMSGLIGELEPDRSKLIQGGSLHHSYPFNLKGKVKGKLEEENLNIFDLMRYNMTDKTPEGQQGNMKQRMYDPDNLTAEDFRSMQLNYPSYVKITDKVLRGLDDRGLLQ